MKKLLSFIAIATCGVVLFAACESSEAVTRNLLEWQGYRYNLTNAQQFVDSPDTLFVIEDGDTLCAGFVYALALNSPGIGFDTLAPNDGDLYYTYPTDGRKFAQLYVYLRSPGLNEICEGTYELVPSVPETKGPEIDEDDFFKITRGYVNYGAPNIGTATKAITEEDREAMDDHTTWNDIKEGTITIKKGMLAYDIEFKAKDENEHSVVGRYTGFVPKTPLIYFPIIY